MKTAFYPVVRARRLEYAKLKGHAVILMSGSDRGCNYDNAMHSVRHGDCCRKCPVFFSLSSRAIQICKSK